ncbi:MAG: SDR family NAD(P)-dependent oxidoreductase, partial [Methanobacteriota archaeon]
MLQIGIHYTDVLEYLMGPIKAVNGRLAQLVLPGMRRRSEGRIVNVSSILGRVSVPFAGAYSASKFALEAATDALRIEESRFGVRVVLVEPGAVATNFRTTARQLADAQVDIGKSAFEAVYRRDLARLETGPGIPPEKVARVIVKAATARLPAARYRVGSDARAADWMRVVPTRLADFLLSRHSGLQRAKK